MPFGVHPRRGSPYWWIPDAALPRLQTRKILQLLRLLQIQNGVFMKVQPLRVPVPS